MNNKWSVYIEGILKPFDYFAGSVIRIIPELQSGFHTSCFEAYLMVLLESY